MTVDQQENSKALTLVSELSERGVTTTVDQLKIAFAKAKQFLEGHWTKRKMARIGSGGLSTSSYNKDATHFCALCAVIQGYRVANNVGRFGVDNWLGNNVSYNQMCELDDSTYIIVGTLFRKFAAKKGWSKYESLPEFNDADETTEQDVLEFFDLCLNLLEN